MIAIYINSDNRVRWDSLQDSRTDAYVNDATVTAELKNAAGTVVASATLAYVAASDGRYQGLLVKAETALLTAGTRYYLEVTATKGGNYDFRRFECIANYKGAT